MTPLRLLRTPTPGLAIGLAFLLSTASSVSAQPMSSGSGAGTGTGMSGGATRNSTGTGLESGGTGERLPGMGRFGPPPQGRAPRTSPSFAVPRGPGANVTNPGDFTTIPLDSVLASGAKTSELSHVTELQLNYARRIPDPDERSLALSRIASAATFAGQLDMAEETLTDASNAAFLMTPGLIQDQRLISTIVALNHLAEDRLREGAGDPALTPAPSSDPNAPPTALPKVDRPDLIRKARIDLRRAAELAERLGNPTSRAEQMATVATAMAQSSQRIVSEFPHESGGDSAPRGLNRSYDGLPDQLLQDAGNIAARIDRPVWHDQALVSVATSAAESLQFSRALTLARMIPLPEVRTNALLKVAEIQARRGDPEGATSTYRDAALAVASIPQDDPRGVLAGVLIDNLIAVGRFEDARSSISLYPDASHQLIALGAIAESQGRRGAGRSALTWINTEVPSQYRSWLYRRVNNGIVAAIEDNRGKDISNRDR